MNDTLAFKFEMFYFILFTSDLETEVILTLLFPLFFETAVRGRRFLPPCLISKSNQRLFTLRT